MSRFLVPALMLKIKMIQGIEIQSRCSIKVLTAQLILRVVNTTMGTFHWEHASNHWEPWVSIGEGQGEHVPPLFKVGGHHMVCHPTFLLAHVKNLVYLCKRVKKK